DGKPNTHRDADGEPDAFSGAVADANPIPNAVKGPAHVQKWCNRTNGEGALQRPSTLSPVVYGQA
ncbi:MAG: hypothetical protein ACUVXE_03990, partial [Anaerolineae bacterium]